MAEKYNYTRYTLLLDLDDPADQELVGWLKQHKTKKNNYSVQIKKALRKLMEAESNG